MTPENFQSFLARSSAEPVYVILGVQGSGTNLLSRLLVRIFGFSVLRDRSLVFDAAARLGRTPSQAAIAREIRKIKRHVFPSAITRKLSHYVIGRNEPFAGLERELQASAVTCGADLARLVYAFRAFSLGTTRMAIKSDDLWQHIDAIDEVLPNRRIILITRDFRDNVVSIGGKAFGPIEPVCVARYVKERLTRYAAEYRRAGDRGYHVKFSTLVESPLTFVEDFARHFQLAPSRDPESVISRFRFRAGRTGKWKVLPSRQLAWCEGILQAELDEFGYPLESGAAVPPGWPTLMAATARDGFLRVPQKIRRVVARLRS